MKRFLFTFAALIFLTITYAQENLRTVKGKVLYLDSPVVNADIEVSGSETISTSKLDGSYEVLAYEGDIITFSYPSLRDMEVVVEDVTRILNITMSPDVNELDEVVVKASKRRSQKDLEEDYAINKRIIRTAWGYVDADRSPGRIAMIQKDEILLGNICILNLIANRFAGIKRVGDCMMGGALVMARGTGTLLPQGSSFIYDVDGQILTDAPYWLDLSVIERIAILGGLATTMPYGAIGSGGVIVINTIGGNIGTNSGKIIDRARLRNNIYSGDALVSTDVAKNEPTYLTEYRATTSVEVAKSLFEKHQRIYRNSPHFLIDSYAYFMDKGAEKLANDILKSNLGLVDKNAVHLKALAYYAEANGAYKEAVDLYEQVFVLRPNYAQSYRDLAEGYRDVQNYKKAASMYARYNYLVDEGFLQADSTGLGTIIDRDSENLMALEGDELMEGSIPTERLAKYAGFQGTRMLFEWNDSEAEFELQFVNPEKHYHIWKHTSVANAERIKDEKLKGYSSEEFLIDGSLAGKWQVNIDYKGNKKLEPTYFKVTTYFNYGQHSQRKEVNVYRLSLKDKNHKLFDLVNSGGITAN